MSRWCVLLLLLCAPVLAENVVLDMRHVPVREVVKSYARLVNKVPLISSSLPERDFDFQTPPAGMERAEAAVALRELLETDGYNLTDVGTDLVRVVRREGPYQALVATNADIAVVVTVPVHLERSVGSDVLAGLTAMSLTGGLVGVRTWFDTRTSSVFLTGATGEVDRAVALVKVMDRRTAQVAIRAAITEVTVNTQTGEGLSVFQEAFKGSVAGAMTGGVAPIPQNLAEVGDSILADASPSLSLFTTFRGLHLESALQLVASSSRVKILSTPFVEVEDGKSAALTVGQSQPYVSTELNQVIGVGNSNGLGQVVGSQVSFLNTAVQLTVTPRVSTNGDVDLVVIQNANDSPGNVVLAGNPVPIQNTRTLQSVLRVGPGDLVALGGLIQESVSTNETHVPVLASLPWVGKAFRQESVQRQRTELIVLIEAEVTRKAEDFEHEIK